VHKVLVRPRLSAPAVVRREASALEVVMEGYHPMFDVPQRWVLLDVNGAVHKAAMPLRDSESDGAPRVVHRLTELTRCTQYTIRARVTVADDPEVDATLGWSPSTCVMTLSPPETPRAPVLSSRGCTTLTLEVHNPGVGSDPVAVSIEVEATGGGVVMRTIVGVGDSARDTVLCEVASLAPGVEYAVRSRCMVEDAAVDACMAWSEPCVAHTRTLEEVRVRISGSAFPFWRVLLSAGIVVWDVGEFSVPCGVSALLLTAVCC
jgi:hypothetical protein